MYLKIDRSNSSLQLTEIDSSDLSSDSSSDDEENKSRHIIIKNLMVQISPKKRSRSKSKDRNKPSPVMVSLSHCKYDVIRNVAKKSGYREVTEDDNWDLNWAEVSITVTQCKALKRFQKLNHFPGMLELCRKDLMARNLNKMLRIFPKDYNFFPKTWCIPSDLGEAMNYSKMNKNRVFILKPDTGSQGKGITLTKSLKESLKDIAPYDRGVCQLYITKPFLIDGYKFDVRVYVLITSCDPLRIYIYKEGLLRFASCKYEEPSADNMSNVFMHLTNYAVNRHSISYNKGSKRKLSWFNNYIKILGHDVEAMWYRVDEVIVKTILSVYPLLKHSYSSRFPEHNVMPACIELLGIDVLFDEALNPQILEVNYSPSYHTDTELDWEVKEALFSDVFAMMGPKFCDKRKIMREDKKRVKTRLTNAGVDSKLTKDKKSFAEYFKQEMSNKGGFRLVYPCSLEHDYAKYLNLGQKPNRRH